MKYRKDIQILRGLAVLLVVLYHLDIGGFRSGFLGVDIFFAVSGYLMAAVFDPSRRADFFLKRARRLLPAYFAVVTLTVLAAVFIVTPNDYDQASEQALFATIFASNIGFWLDNSYFDKSAFKPLLHLWSLGVEIQFYALVPLVAWVFARYKRLFLLVALVSAALCFVVVGVSPKTAFFWLPFRLWEFLVGFAAGKQVQASGREETGPSSWIGLAALAAVVAVPLAGTDGTALGFRHGHPGLLALLVVLATATMLRVGLPDRIMRNPVAGALERIGDHSYSIYLVHFPLIVLFLYRPFSGTVLEPAGPGQGLVLAALIAGASVLLHALVERPLRFDRRAIRWVAAAAAVVVVAGPAGRLLQQAFIPAREMPIYDAWLDRDVYRCGKLTRILHPTAISCEITPALAAPSRRVLLVGNSHADAIKGTFAAAAEAANVAVYFLVPNDPLLPAGPTPQRVVQEAEARRADAIVLDYSPHSIDGRAVRTLVELAAGKRLRVSLIMPVPVWDKHVPLALWQHLKEGAPLPSQTLSDYRSFNAALADILAGIGRDKVEVYDVAEVFCHSSCLLASPDGKPFYFDAGHLTRTGSTMLRGVFDRIIADL